MDFLTLGIHKYSTQTALPRTKFRTRSVTLLDLEAMPNNHFQVHLEVSVGIDMIYP